MSSEQRWSHMRCSNERFIVVGLALVLGAFAASAQPLPVKPFSDGCVPTALSCGTTLVAQLAAGDCSDSEGYYDEFVYDGKAGDVITASVVSLEPSSYDGPALEIDPDIIANFSSSAIALRHSTGATRVEATVTLPYAGRWYIYPFSGSNVFARGHY